MSETSVEKLKVFISWSKEPSREVATSLRTGLLSVFDMVQPFVSEIDIEAGDRGLRVIEAALRGSGFGIIVVTPENMEAPWLNFEAGALSKALGDDETRVIPLLVGFTSMTQLTGPLVQFQARFATEEKIIELFHALGEQVGVKREIVTHRLSGWLPSFMRTIEAAQQADSAVPQKRSQEDLLSELLDLVRGLRRDVSSPEPRDATAIERNNARRDLAVARMRLRRLLERSGVEGASVIARNADGTWVVDVPSPLNLAALEAAREAIDEDGFSVTYTADGKVIVA